MSSDAFAGRACVITGALGGPGRAMATAFRDRGAKVAVLDLDAAAACRFAEELGGGAIGIGLDITDADQVAAAVAGVTQAFGGLDVLVNNAAVRHELAFLDHDAESWRHTLDVNLTGAFLCAQAAARIMVARGGGKIVNLGSVAADQAFRRRAAYVASKAGIAGLTRAIAWELGPRGVHCNAVAPGIIETPLTAHYFKDKALNARIREGTALGRPGRPEDVVGAVLFLCGPASDFIQGETLHVDGGWLSGKGY